MELVESPTTGPPYSSLELASQHSVVSVVLAVVVAVLVAAVIADLLPQHWGANGRSLGQQAKGRGAAGMSHATPGCCVAAGKSGACTYSSASGRLGPGRAGGGRAGGGER